MILGFTGTRVGMTPAQRAALRDDAVPLAATLIHGGAPGSDEEFDAFMVAAGLPITAIEVYPTSDYRATMWRGDGSGRTVHPPMAPLVRNRIIVARCTRLLATPITMIEIVRSGTWATIRYARAAGKPVTILRPDGTVIEEIK